MTFRAGLMLSVCLLVTGCEPRDAGVASRVPTHTYGNSAGNGSLGFHTVGAGDTIWRISQRYGLVVRDILDANHLQPPYKVPPGTRLTLPAPRTYKVRGGESIYNVSRLFDISATDLARLNRLKAPYRLRAGQILKLPSEYEAPASAQPAALRGPDMPRLGSDRIEAVPLAPQNEAPSRNQRYIPPSSSPSDYEDASAPPAAAQGAAKTIGAPPPLSGRFIKPVAGRVISGYGEKADGLHNDGINIQAARGDPVRAAESGVIVYTGNQIEGYGNLILIRHAGQYVTAYAHLDKTLVKKGDLVKRGQTVGTVGATGSVDKPQLHFEIRKGTKALDPKDLIAL